MAPYNSEILTNGHLSNRGLWVQTATIDWCESNYELSYYIAEFWNTISNLAFIIPQLAQYFALAQYKSVENEFRSAFLSLALVGIGSFCFHMTLARPMQMFDETSMILVSLHGFYLLCLIKNPFLNRRLLITSLVFYGLVFLSLYVFLVSYPIFHHTTFGLLVYVSVIVGYQLKKLYGPYYKFWTVLILQHTAFVFWLIDKHYCDMLTYFRNNYVPDFVRPVFQFHALWHLLMGIGSHVFICGLIRLRAWTMYNEEFVLKYKYLRLWITLERVEPADSPLRKMGKKRIVSHQQSDQSKTGLKPRSKKQLPRDANHPIDLNQNRVNDSGYL